MSKTIPLTKICNKCKLEKEYVCFGTRTANKDGKRSQCKECEKQYVAENYDKVKLHRKQYKQENRDSILKKSREYHAKNKDKKKEYYENNKEKILEQCKQNREKNKEEIAARHKVYYQDNKSRIQEYKLKYREENKDFLKKQGKKYYNQNKEAFLEKCSRYRSTEKGKIVHKNSCLKRRALKRQGDVISDDLLELQQNAKVCYWCNKSLKNKQVHIDHYIPLSKGGEHTQSNLVVSCGACNMQKHTTDPFVFANSMGKLL